MKECKDNGAQAIIKEALKVGFQLGFQNGFSDKWEMLKEEELGKLWKNYYEKKIKVDERYLKIDTLENKAKTLDQLEEWLVKKARPSNFTNQAANILSQLREFKELNELGEMV